MDLKWPIEIDSAGRLVTVDGIPETKQRVSIVLKAGLGEWAFDTSYGIPWREIAQTRPAPIGAIRANIVAQLLRTPGVDSVDSLIVTEGPERELIVEGSITVSGVSVEL